MTSQPSYIGVHGILRANVLYESKCVFLHAKISTRIDLSKSTIIPKRHQAC